MNPNELIYSNTEKIWWKCIKGHEWRAMYVSRSKRKSKCPYCSGLRAILGVNDLATEYPELMLEWNFSKNEVNPIYLKSVSGKKVWWKCAKGHEWQAVINTRSVRGYKCPYCTGKKVVSGEKDLAALYPDFIKQWDYEKNKEINPNEVAHSSHQIVWWLCHAGHSYEMAIQKRTDRGYGCPYCAGRYPIAGYNDLETLHSNIINIWNFERNKIKPSECTIGSGKMVWWRCLKGHEWKKTITQQNKYNFCPYCEGKLLITGINDVATLHPELIKDWDVNMNEKKPSDVKYSTHKKVWWKCEKGHSWEALIDNKIKGKGCPYCNGKKSVKGENDFETLAPDLVKEWNWDKNLRIEPSDFKKKSNKKVWWKCEKGHEWKAAISDRTSGTRCPLCSKE